MLYSCTAGNRGLKWKQYLINNEFWSDELENGQQQTESESESWTMAILL